MRFASTSRAAFTDLNRGQVLKPPSYDRLPGFARLHAIR